MADATLGIETTGSWVADVMFGELSAACEWISNEVSWAGTDGLMVSD